MKELMKNLKTKYQGLRYSNTVKDKQWWFTISPDSFTNKTLHLMLIHAKDNKFVILKIDTNKQLTEIIPRNGEVHLTGQYDLYFILEQDNSITMKYLTNDGYQTQRIDSNIVEQSQLIDSKDLHLTFIKNVEDLKENLITIESYLRNECTEDEMNFALSLIQKGKNIVAYKVHDEFHFAPSRFVGYKKNDMYKHLANETKDGRDTTPIINETQNRKLQEDESLEEKYILYCNQLGIEIHDNKRQYWQFDFTGTTLEKLATNCEQEFYKEGKKSEAIHKKRERNRKLVLDAKNLFRKNNNNKIFCEICEFNFKDIYGIEYIEVHHLKELANMEEGDVTSLDDVCLVCPNCHCIIHSKYPCLTIQEVKEIIAENNSK